MGYVNPGDERRVDPAQVYPPPTATSPAERTSGTPAVDQTTERVMAGGGMVEAIGGAGAVVLSIIGLGHVLPAWMAAISAIVVGVALIAQGGAIAARLDELIRELGASGRRTQIGGGVGAEIIGGGAAIVLGILALVGVDPGTLLPVAAIVLGGTLLFGGGAQPELAAVDGHGVSPRVADATRRMVQASGGVFALAGIAAAVLGILSLLGIGPFLTMVLVSTLVVGAAVLLNGGALTGRLMPHLR